MNVSTPAWKRILDFVCILVGLPGALFFMLLIAAVIKLVSRGPILIRQERVGFGCKRFDCLKFRTMHVGADTNVHREHLNHLLRSDRPMVKMDSKGDPRLIRFGALLRATGLDELPQLINVLRGEMSIVGPRPCLPYEFELYEPWQRERFDTLPGLTGLWQVRGKNQTTFAEMIRLDIQYARTRSFWLDVRILAATFGTLAAQVKALRRERSAAAPHRSGAAPIVTVTNHTTSGCDREPTVTRPAHESRTTTPVLEARR